MSNVYRKTATELSLWKKISEGGLQQSRDTVASKGLWGLISYTVRRSQNDFLQKNDAGLVPLTC